MRCPHCGSANNDEARFCTRCGTPLERACPACGAPADEDDRFCGRCGTRLPWADDTAPAAVPRVAAPPEPEAERREVTVLFADLSGFTHWSSQLDPEETHALLNRYFGAADEIVRSYGGSIDKHIGDAVMAVFGAPVSHGNDAERAVRAAIDIHAALATFEPALTAHIGIANGVVVASRTGSDAHREYTVTGNSVNLASRLQGLAADGETLVSESVRNAVASCFIWEPRGEMAIKGLDRPASVWRAVEAAAPHASPERAIVGRASELEQFATLLRTMLDQGRGATIRVRGEPGIGKSRLVEEFRRRAEAMGVPCHAGLVLDFGAGRGGDAIGAIARSLLGIAGTTAADTREATLGEAVAGGLIAAENCIFLADLIDLPQPAELRSIYDAMPQAERSHGRETTLGELVAARARAKPILILIEDVHWADESTLSYLAALARSAASSPLALVVTTRIEGDPLDTHWRAAAGGVPLVTIDLAPLNADEAARLAKTEFDIADDLIRNCVERAAGNPLFLEQLLRSATETSRDTLPGTVQSLVQSRMDRLSVEDRHALQAASVLGQRFSPLAVRHLLGDEAYSCRSLVEHFLVRPVGDGFMFTHALVRDGVYSSLISSRRKELHRAAADWFADRDLTLRAEHLARADDPAAAGAFSDAARAEMEAFHADRALVLTGEGLKTAEGPVRHALSCLRGDLLRGLGEIDASIAAFEDALAVAATGRDTCLALIGIAEGMRAAGRFTEAVAMADRANQAVGDDEPLLKAEVHHLRGNLAFPAGDAEACLREHETALRYARLTGSRAWEARALSGLGDASYLAAKMRTAAGYFDRCVALSAELGLGRVEVANRHMVGWTRIYLNQLAEARREGDLALELAQRSSQARAEMLSRQLLGWVCIELCDFDAATLHTDASSVLARRAGHGNFIAQSLSQVAQIAVLTDRPQDAVGPLDEAIEILKRGGMGFVGPIIFAIRGRVEPDPARKAEFFAISDRAFAEGCVSHNYFWGYRERIEAALETGDWDTALDYAGRLESYAAAEPLPWSDFQVALARALARRGLEGGNAENTAEIERLHTQAGNAGYARALRVIARIAP